MPIFTQKIHTLSLTLAAILTITASPCLEADPIDPSSISAIDLQVSDVNMQQFGQTFSAAELRDQVLSKLSEWPFPLKSINNAYSHSLTASLGQVSNQSTPVGFSFSAGNSDPRAVNFQKADVLEVNCNLQSKTHPQQSKQQTSTFSVHSFSADSSKAKLQDKLSDQISTACFSLLDDLHLARKISNGVESHEFKPSWMPEVRIEVKETPAIKTDPLTTTTESVNEDARKEIIIHNQGTPLILNLGHERR